MPAEPRFNPLAAAEPLPRKRKWLRRLAIAFVLFLVAVVTGYGVWRYQASTARDAEIAKIQAAGEPVWFADLKPQPLDPAVDGTPLLLQAFDAIESIPDDLRNDLDALRRPFEDVPLATEEPDDLGLDEGDWEDELNVVAPGLDEQEPGNLPGEPEENIDVEREDEPRLEDVMPADDPLAESPADDAEQPPGNASSLPFAAREAKVVEKLRPYLANNREVYRLLAKALEKGQFQFDVDYDARVPTFSEHQERDPLSSLRTLLQARWRCQIHDGDYEAATASILQYLVFIRGVLEASQHNSIDTSLGAYTVTLGVAMLAETMARNGSGQPIDASVYELLRDLEAMFRSRPVLLKERAAMLTTIENVFEFGVDGEPLIRSKFIRTLFAPQIRMNQALYLESMAQLIDYADRHDPATMQAIEKFEESRLNSFGKVNPANFWFAIKLLPMFHPNEDARVTRDRLRSAQVGLQVDAFRRVNGRLPKSLDEIKNPGFLTIPRDVADHGPLVYLADKDAFTVCSLADSDLERKRLAEQVKMRDASQEPESAEKDPLEQFPPHLEESEEKVDNRRTGPFQIIYPNTNDAKAGSSPE
jgi:hypothetical protein